MIEEKNDSLKQNKGNYGDSSFQSSTGVGGVKTQTVGLVKGVLSENGRRVKTEGSLKRLIESKMQSKREKGLCF